MKRFKEALLLLTVLLIGSVLRFAIGACTTGVQTE